MSDDMEDTLLHICAVVGVLGNSQDPQLECLAAHFKKTLDTHVAFHGTGSANAVDQTGLKQSEKGMLGKGVYLAHDRRKAEDFAKIRSAKAGPPEQSKVYRVEFHSGNVKVIDTTDFKGTWRKEGYDAVYEKGHTNRTEMCVNTDEVKLHREEAAKEFTAKHLEQARAKLDELFMSHPKLRSACLYMVTVGEWNLSASQQSLLGLLGRVMQVSSAISFASKLRENSAPTWLRDTTALLALATAACGAAAGIYNISQLPKPWLCPSDQRTWKFKDPESENGTGYAVQYNANSEVVNCISYKGKFDQKDPQPSLGIFWLAVDLLSRPIEYFETFKSLKDERKLLIAWMQNVVGPTYERYVTHRTLNGLVNSIQGGKLEDACGSVMGETVSKLVGQAVEFLDARQLFEMLQALWDACNVGCKALACKSVQCGVDIAATCVGRQVVKPALEALGAVAEKPPWWKFWKANPVPPSRWKSLVAKNSGVLVGIGIGLVQTVTSSAYKRLTKLDRVNKLVLQLGMAERDVVDGLNEAAVNARSGELFKLLHPDKTRSSISRRLFEEVLAAKTSLVQEIRNHEKSLARKALDFTAQFAYNSAMNSMGLVGTALSWAVSRVMGSVVGPDAIVPATKPWWKFW